MKKENKHFDALEQIKSPKKEMMMAEGLIFVTKGTFYGHEIEKIKGEAPINDPYSVEQRVYGGTLIVSKSEDWSEANIIAKERGWNEKVEGVLYERFSANDDEPTKPINFN